MPKNVVEDIKRASPRKTISKSVNEEEIVLPVKHPKEKVVHFEATSFKEKKFFSRPRNIAIPSLPKMPNNNIRINPTIKWIFIGSLIIGAFYWFSVFTLHAKILIKQKTQEINFKNEQFTALKNADSSLNFEIMILPDRIDKKITFDESKNVSNKAHGTVVLYNNYSNKVQSIPVRTILSDKNNREYLTDTKVNIPGYTIKNKAIIPGSATINITAIQAGSEYNGDPRDFVINSFKGTAKESKIYGRSKTSLSGGALGVIYNLSPEQIGTLHAIADTTFRATMQKKLNALVPDGYILYKDATQFSYKVDENQTSPLKDGVAYIDATIKAIIIKKDDLSKAIIHHSIKNLNNEEFNEIKIKDISAFNFAFNDTNIQITKDLNNVSFNLNGSSTMIWTPDIDNLIKSLVGVDKNNTTDIFAKDPGILNATVTIFPPWQKYLPNNRDKIKVILE